MLFLFLFQLAKASSFLSLPVKRYVVNDTASPISSAASNLVVQSNLTNFVYSYEVEFYLGTPPQKQRARIDTGSSDLWVYAPSSNAPDVYTFNNLTSTTSSFVFDDFDLGYVDGEHASGYYLRDKVTFGNGNATLQFALNTQPFNGKKSILGLGTRKIEAASTTYDNLPFALQEAGVIECASYSLYLNDQDADNGTLLFGAVDQSRYNGTLQLTPLNKDERSVLFNVVGYTIWGILDSGTSLSYLPDDIVATIAFKFNCVWSKDRKAYQFMGTPSNESLTFTFGVTQITMPATDLFMQIFNDSKGYFLSIIPYSQSKGYVFLGDNFLRSAYVVYDLKNKMVAIGQSNLTPSKPDYKVIKGEGLMGSNIPNATWY